MKIVLTGAGGFIGRHVIPQLIAKGHEVIAVVRNQQTASGFQNQCQIIEHCIGTDDKRVFAQLNQADALIHLAWGGLPNYRSMHHIETELPLHYQFIKGLIVEAGVRQIAVAGTCFEYGMQSGSLSENIQTKPDNPYGFAKDTLRKQLEFLSNEQDFNLTWMRLFYLYGEDQPANTLYSQLRAAIKKGDPVFNMSGGEQLRDYLHIDQVAQAIAQLVGRKENTGVVNICSGLPISVRRLVEQWKAANNWNISLNLGHYPYPDYEPFAFWGDNTKYQSLVSNSL